MVVKTLDSGMNVSCCGKEMKELIPAESDGMMEKHLPVVECRCDGTLKVRVGTRPHPMTEDHQIMFIYLETEHGGCLRYLEAGKPAEAVFHICKDKPVAVYAYCNIHGLWKTEVQK